MDEISKRRRDAQGRLLPAEAPDDYSRYAMGDRDEAAKAAKAADMRVRRAAASEAAGRGAATGGDVRKVAVTAMLSDREAAVLYERLAELGITKSEFARRLLLEALGIEDTARRAAPQRPSRARRQREEGQQS